MLRAAVLIQRLKTKPAIAAIIKNPNPTPTHNRLPTVSFSLSPPHSQGLKRAIHIFIAIFPQTQRDRGCQGFAFSLSLSLHLSQHHRRGRIPFACISNSLAQTFLGLQFGVRNGVSRQILRGIAVRIRVPTAEKSTVISLISSFWSNP